jgi:hypothetical protein
MSANGVQRLSGNNRFCGPFAFDFVASNAHLDSHEKMRLRANPLSKPYVEYLLRVGNGQESSIIDHFPPEVDAKHSIGVEIALYPEIHQAPSLETSSTLFSWPWQSITQTKDTWTVELF